MGDVGSGFLGYTLAVLPVIAALSNSRYIMVGVLLLWPFLFDTVFTFLRRLGRAENIFAAHRSHLYQRLVITGHSHRSVTLLYTILALIGALLSFFWLRGGTLSHAVTVLLLPLLCLALWFYVVRQERKRAARVSHGAAMLGERL
jgi:Fuc2NAc and GlcNAc transferase